MQTQDQTSIATFSSQAQAIAAQRRLQSAGVHAQVSDINADPESRELTTSADRFRLSVDADLSDIARQTLACREPSVLRPGEWLCSACGETGDPGFVQCWSCGSTRSGYVEEMEPIVSQGGCGCGTGGCGTSSKSGDRVLSIEFPAEWDQSIQQHDHVAQRALMAAAVGVVLPPALFYAGILVGKSALAPLSSKGSQRFYAAFALTVSASIGWVMVLFRTL